MEKSMNIEVLIWAYNKGYRVDNRGNVYYKSKKRSLVSDTRGYLSFTVRIKLDGKDVFRRVWVHRLCAYQKYGDIMFKERIEVRHLNGNSKDNSKNNILIGTSSKNRMDIPESIRRTRAIKASYTNRRFTDSEVKSIITDKKNGLTYNQLILKYNTCKGTLSYLFNKAQYNIAK